MHSKHAAARTSAVFDDPHLLPAAGLVSVMNLAGRAGLHDLVNDLVHPGGPCGVNAAAKITTLIAGMAAGADCIDDMDILRHGAMPEVFTGGRAPSTLGSHLRSYSWGNVRQLGKVHREVLAELTRIAPLLPGADVLAFIDVDSTQKRVYGYQKQGARFGHTKIQGKSVLVRGLNALTAVVSTPLAAPVLAATRLRGGSAASPRGAASLVTEAIGTARAAGATGRIVVRLDSGFYSSGVLRAVTRAGAKFSVTARADKAICRAIASIPEQAWVPIRYPQAIWDDQAGRWVSDAEVAEIGYTAFTSRKKSEQVTGRLIVRRVKALNPEANAGQDELFAAYRHHPVFTSSPFAMITAEEQHRDHAVVEQVYSDLYDGPLAHLPSGSFAANAAWLALAAITQNLQRAAGTLAGKRYAKARGATIRRDLINVPARIARRGRGDLILHLPEGWHRQTEWAQLFNAAGPPVLAA